MNFFGKGKGKKQNPAPEILPDSPTSETPPDPQPDLAPPSEDLTAQPTEAPVEAVVAEEGQGKKSLFARLKPSRPEASQPDMPPVNEDPPEPEPAQGAPVEETGKKKRFARLKPSRPQFALPGRKAESQDVTEATQAMAQVTVNEDPVDPMKLARRKARRAKRQQQEEEWEEEHRKRRNFAILNNLPMEELEPLPPFTSASESEGEPEVVASPPQDQTGSMHHTGPPVSVVAEGVLPSRSGSAMKGPFIPQAASPTAVVPGDPVHAAPVSAAPVSAAPMQPAGGPGQHVQQPAVAPQRDPSQDAAMAEMFGAQAYVGSAMPQAAPVMQPSAPAEHEVGAQQMHSQSRIVRAPTNPTPIGWGGVYHEVPSQPMFGMPMHLSRGPHPTDIDPMLADKIRRGRELANLAIEQESSGNLGAAENGYMKALELLVPASKELDVGSELNKNYRMQQKAKIQREAAAMMDRCEQLRVFLRANGAATPQELPAVPAVKPGGSGTRPSVPRPPKFDSDTSRGVSNTDVKGPSDSFRAPPPNRPPPPAPPSFSENSDDLFQKLTSRKNVLSAASKGVLMGGYSGDDNAAVPPEKPRRVTSEKCFMCNSQADLKANCGHTFCTKCGNQAASVFGRCPDPSCGTALNASEFTSIL